MDNKDEAFKFWNEWKTKADIESPLIITILGLSILLAIYNLVICFRGYQGTTFHTHNLKSNDKNNNISTNVVINNVNAKRFRWFLVVGGVLNLILLSSHFIVQVLVTVQIYHGSKVIYWYVIEALCVVSGCIGVKGLTDLCYMLAIIYRVRILRSVVNYNKIYDMILFYLTIAVFLIDPLVVSPYRYIVCPPKGPITYKPELFCVLTFPGAITMFYWTFTAIYFFMVEFCLGVLLIRALKPKRQSIPKNLTLMLTIWGLFNVLNLVTAFANYLFIYFPPFPTFIFHQLFGTITYFLNEKFSLAIAFAVRLRTVKNNNRGGDDDVSTQFIFSLPFVKSSVTNTTSINVAGVA